MPAFSNNWPWSRDMTPPPPSAPMWSLRAQFLGKKRAGSPLPPSSPSSTSNSEQRSSRRFSNQARATALRGSKGEIIPRSVAKDGRKYNAISRHTLGFLQNKLADSPIRKLGHRDCGVAKRTPARQKPFDRCVALQKSDM